MHDLNNPDRNVVKQDIADIFKIVAERGTPDTPIGSSKTFALDDIYTQENSTFRILSIGDDSLTENCKGGSVYYRNDLDPGKLHAIAEKLRGLPKLG